MAKLSVVISAYNEEKNIKDCLESVRDLADEIILVDNTSTDKTVEIAKKYQAVVYSRPNNSMLNINKNFGFKKANGDWVLNLDADERVSPELKDEIRNSILTQKSAVAGNCVGFCIPRKNIIFGKWIRSQMWWPDYQLRLFKKGKGQFPERHVHEYLEVEGETGKMENPLIHENYSSISQFLYKLDKIYTENEAEVFLKSGKKTNWTDAIKWPFSDFLKTFFSQKGYQDDQHGLVLSLLQAFYSEITFAKIWEREGFSDIKIDHQELKRELEKLTRELNYWLLTMEIEETKNPFKKLLLKIKRKGGF